MCPLRRVSPRAGKEGDFWYSFQTMHDLMSFQQVTPLSSLFQRCQITLLQPLFIRQLSQCCYHLRSTMLDLLKCVYVLLQICGPCLYAVLLMWFYCCFDDVLPYIINLRSSKYFVTFETTIWRLWEIRFSREFPVRKASPSDASSSSVDWQPR